MEANSVHLRSQRNRRQDQAGRILSREERVADPRVTGWRAACILAFAMAWGPVVSPAPATAAGQDRFGVIRFLSEPQSYWRDSSTAPIVLAQATPADSNADNEEGSDTLGAPPSQPAPTPAPGGNKVTPIAPATADSGSKAVTLPITPGSAPPETLRTSPGSTALPDSLRARTAPPETLRATSAPPETLFAPAPHGIGPRATPPVSPPPKQRTGIWGVHPIAILLGLAVLHYFITKSVN